MIWLARECLLLVTESGEAFPCSVEQISVELVDTAGTIFPAEFLPDTIQAIWYYFKHDQGRNTVTIKEFAQALELVLVELRAGIHPQHPIPPTGIAESNLMRVAQNAEGALWELGFFPRLRAELRRQMNTAPCILKIGGLRPCVKQLTGAKRWNHRCRRLSEQIIHYVRDCLKVEGNRQPYTLVIQ